MSDLIDRWAAIALIHSLYPSAPIMRMNRKRWEKKYEPYIEAEKALEQMPSAQPYTEAELQKMQDLYQAEIGKAFELGQEDARSEIIHCGECKHRDPEDHKCDCGHDILWQLPRQDDWYCADAERKEGETDGRTD